MSLQQWLHYKYKRLCPVAVLAIRYSNTHPHLSYAANTCALALVLVVLCRLLTRIDIFALVLCRQQVIHQRRAKVTPTRPNSHKHKSRS